jgi:hypothetical protein
MHALVIVIEASEHNCDCKEECQSLASATLGPAGKLQRTMPLVLDPKKSSKERIILQSDPAPVPCA